MTSYSIELGTRNPGWHSACPATPTPPWSADYKFALKQGQSFTVEGLVAELDGASGDCGFPPNYIPTSFASQCFTRFSKTYNYNELARGGRGDTVAVNASNGGVQGGDKCAWQVQMFLEVN